MSEYQTAILLPLSQNAEFWWKNEVEEYFELQLMVLMRIGLAGLFILVLGRDATAIGE